MIKQKLFSSHYIENLRKSTCSKAGWELYTKDLFDFKNIYVLENPQIFVPNSIDLVLPEKGNSHDIDNCKIIYEALRDMDPIQATDYRIWVYLTHVPFWSYMRKRRPVEKQPEGKKSEYIIRHWFVDGISAKNLLRNDISSFWWCGYLTYDKRRKNPYELTEELYSMLDYTRHLLPGKQVRNREFVHALLEFVIENTALFSTHKEEKVRFLMRKFNYISGYKILASLNKEEIKSIFQSYVDEVKKIKSRDDEEKK